MAARSVVLLVLVLVLQACGVLPQTGPPDISGTYYTLSHGRP